jgi:hypothetical protein
MTVVAGLKGSPHAHALAARMKLARNRCSCCIIIIILLLFAPLFSKSFAKALLSSKDPIAKQGSNLLDVLLSSMRYDLSFFLCCCKSFLGGSGDNADDFYALLQIEHDASPEEIKRAYKQQSLLMHPDKLAQRGLQPTPEDHARFTRMKEAYEVLSDPHQRETYDAIGTRHEMAGRTIQY